MFCQYKTFFLAYMKYKTASGQLFGFVSFRCTYIFDLADCLGRDLCLLSLPYSEKKTTTVVNILKSRYVVYGRLVPFESTL